MPIPPSRALSARSSWLVLALLLAPWTAAPAAAQATRTWVSGVGDDANPCSRTAPCKTWAGAISKTANGGEINALDPAGYGAVTITKNIVIDGGGVHASILASSTTGVIVNGTNVRVVLRRLSINGASDAPSPGVTGVRFLQGAELHVEDCVIENFSQLGISAEGSGNLHVADTVIRNIGGAGIRVTPGGGTPRVTVEGSRLATVGIGLRVAGSLVALAHDTSVTDSSAAGFWAENGAELHLHDAVVAHSGVGVQASGGAVINTAGLTAVNNAGGAFLAEAGGVIVPFAGELITGNPAGGPSTCEIGGASSPVACLGGGDPVCPTPVCPTPECPAPVVQASLGNCKKCKTKGTKMVCTGCGIDLQ
ncbi:MAG: right-handed parallel beta-helix repeat-containing protein [bacterium]|nr:right-handed parallel beta-helix repeat-containing protein [bacterium]